MTTTTNNVIRETYTCMGYLLEKSIYTKGWVVRKDPHGDVLISAFTKGEAVDWVREQVAKQFQELKPELTYLLEEYLGMLETSDAPCALGRMKRVNAVLEKMGC